MKPHFRIATDVESLKNVSPAKTATKDSEKFIQAFFYPSYSTMNLFDKTLS